MRGEGRAKEEEGEEGKERSVHVGELPGARKRKRRRGEGEVGEIWHSTTLIITLADSLGARGRSHLPWGKRKRTSSVGMPVLPMNILHSSHLTPPTVNC